jgi:glutamate-1-semialdehyde aminotransferase/acyl carrier protein
MNGEETIEMAIELQSESRRDMVLSIIRSLVAQLLQYPEYEVDIYAPLLEMGADSMVFVDAVRRLETVFDVKISIRQLFDELSTIDGLTDYIDQNLSPDWRPEGEDVAAETATLPIQTELETTKTDTGVAETYPAMIPLPQQPIFQTPAFSIMSENKLSNGQQLRPDYLTDDMEDTLERVISQQLQVMSEQLAVLHSRGTAGVYYPAEGKTEKIAPAGQSAGGSQSSNGYHRAASQPEAKVAKPTPTTGTVGTSTAAKAKPVSPFNMSKEIRKGGFTAQQQAHLDNLIDRYTQRTGKSKEFAQQYRPVLTDNRASAGFRLSIKEMLYPIVGQRAEGARVWDLDGNEYIDIAMGFGVYLFGHQPPFVMEALKAQLDESIHLGPQCYLAGEVAQLIHEVTGVDRVAFHNSGTEAVMTALRLARTAVGRNKYAMFTGSYHGHFDGTLGVPEWGDSPFAVPLTPGVSPNMLQDCLMLDYGEPEALRQIEAYADELAAVIVEPIQSRRPELQPKAFLQELRQLTQEKGIVLIYDEMITGFRLHQGGAQAWYGVEADLVTYGKVVGGGMPIGVTAGKADYMAGLDGGMWQFGDDSYPPADTTFFAGTFCKHPLAMAAARAVLQHLQKEGPELQERLNERTTRLAQRLNDFFIDEEVPVRVVHFGSLYRFDFKGNMDLLFYHLMEKGVYTWEGRTCFVTTAHTDEDLDYVVTAVKESVAELRSGGFLPERTLRSTNGHG